MQLEVTIVDCASSDGTAQRLEAAKSEQRCRWPLRVELSDRNLGFAAGMNRAIAALEESSRFVLSLNADARPQPDALARLVSSFERYGRLHRLGAVTPRLVRPSATPAPRQLDACGMRLSISWRHFDRGSDQIDSGQFARPALVFGGTGAATLFLRQALEDVSLRPGEVFDPDFFTYREDAELAFRLQERGWQTLYEPGSVFEHRRGNLPHQRGELTDVLRMHTLKNRYLLRLYHHTPLNFLITLVPSGLREIGIVLHVLLRERQSIDSFRWLMRNRSRLLARRRQLRQRRTAARWQVDRWLLRSEVPVVTDGAQ